MARQRVGVLHLACTGPLRFPVLQNPSTASSGRSSTLVALGLT